MAETKRMTAEQVVGYLLDGEGLDFLRESLSWVVHQLMEAEVSELVGAARGERAPDERLTHRNGYRTRPWATRAGELELAIPKLRRGSYLYIVEYGGTGGQGHVVRKVDRSGKISTLAGAVGLRGFSGDGGPSRRARLYQPTDVAVDPAGNVYIADWHNHRIRKVDLRGTITTVAGGGSTIPGDGGPATKAALDSPSHIAIDRRGNLYISDRGRYTVRKIANATPIARFAATPAHRRGAADGHVRRVRVTRP
jgi:hypothetical protein